MVAPRIREASFDDYSQISQLLSQYGLAHKHFEEWKPLWVNNPAYVRFQEKLPIGWVLECTNNQIVGYLGNIPLFYEFEGQRLLACVAHAWVVDTRYRGYSLQLLDRYFSQKSVELFLNATVGPAASESFAVFQSSPVPVGAWDRSSFWITNYQRFVAGWLSMRGLSSAKPASRLLSVGSFFGRVLSKRMSNGRVQDLKVQDCPVIDNRFDFFWNALRNANPHMLLGVRSRDTLEWHFRQALANNKAWVVVASESCSITAYGVFLRYDNEKYGLRRMRLVDFQTLDGNTAVLAPMLDWALGRCHREGIEMLESIGFCSEKQKLIAKIAPYERRLPSWLYFYKARDKSLADRLKDPTVWDPSQFDGDASL
jgi:hypothetical protein